MREGEDITEALRRIERRETIFDDDFYDTIAKAIETIENLRCTQVE
jgi:hypothetical protein